MLSYEILNKMVHSVEETVYDNLIRTAEFVKVPYENATYASCTAEIYCASVGDYAFNLSICTNKDSGKKTCCLQVCFIWAGPIQKIETFVF